MVVKIKFDETYEITSVTPDLRVATFYSIDKEGNAVLLKMKIKPVDYALLPNVYNLSFGTLKQDDKIDDTTRIAHQDHNKVFSTILFFALTFLEVNPTITIGIDGSNDARAYIYHRMFHTNKEYLSEYFVALGVDWFVRLLRNEDIERLEDGSPFFKPRPEPFDYQRNTRDLYRYYMFHLRNNTI
jgi:hypothetical protein